MREAQGVLCVFDELVDHSKEQGQALAWRTPCQLQLFIMTLGEDKGPEATDSASYQSWSAPDSG